VVHIILVLSQRDPRAKNFEKTPLSYGVSKHGNPPIPFKTRVLERAKEDFEEKILAVVKPILVGNQIKDTLSDQQIFGGIPGMDECKRLELHTSEGYPLQLERPSNVHNKSWLFKFTQTEEGNILHDIHPLLKDMHELHMEVRKKGDIPTTIFC